MSSNNEEITNEFELFYNELDNLIENGFFKKALELINKKNIDNVKIKIKKADVYLKTGKYSDALEIIDSIDKDKLTLLDIFDILVLRFYIDFRRGMFDELSSIELKMKSLVSKFKNENELNTVMAEYYHIKGIINSHKGNFHKAIINYNLSLEYRLKNNNINRIGDTYNNLGIIYYNLGMYDKALSYYKRSYKNYLLSENYINQVISLYNTGIVYYYTNRPEDALSYFLHALELMNEHENLDQRLQIYFFIALSYISLKNEKKAIEYINYIDENSSKVDNTRIENLSKIAKAIVLKSHNKIKDRAKAQIMLNEVLKEKNLYFDTTAFVSYHLAELLFDEYSIMGSEEALTELYELIDKIESSALKESHFSAIIYVKLFRTRIELVKKNLENAFIYLKQGKELCIKNNLKYLQNVVDGFQKKIEKEIGEWESKVKEKNKIHQSIIKKEINNYIDEISDIISNTEFGNK